MTVNLVNLKIFVGSDYLLTEGAVNQQLEVVELGIAS